MLSLQRDGVTSFGATPYISLTVASALEYLASGKIDLYKTSELQVKIVVRVIVNICCQRKLKSHEAPFYVFKEESR